MNKILFSIIGALLLAVVGVGGVSAYDTFVVEKKLVEGTAGTQPQNTQGTSSLDVSDDDTLARENDDEEEDEEDDDGGTTAAQPAQGSGGGSAGSVGATSPAPTAGTYTMAQVKQHNTSSNCYTAINGSVYNVTSWIKQHPGGAQEIISLCGIDGSAAFSAQHNGQSRPASELAAFKIGTLVQ
jgi:cytochrome b involved in lipid metabolism